ncbi:class I SAM-dependent methyltransferase [Microlunatus elymi]|uniref:Class I SAM-dependent methyltransferase n=1 Tax=Microlunatus elymi TaxID=2596828 RepID=A0A516Q2A8_9ACTN|nr:class I SAM-dependent methyltransferase [Microlunatus elymi]QDP97570.1 class I SAM-dependent methyltransferase [Microlunatus elymi]
MGFNVAAELYGRFMGRYSEPLSALFSNYAGIAPGQRVLDVGCGPGALTARLAEILGPQQVTAIDPSPPFVEATSTRCPGVEVRQGVAEQLPYPDATFDAALAQLVVHFMRDPVAGLREMSRVTRPGGVIAACVWDHAGGHGPVSTFWEVVHELDPNAGDESQLAGVREGELVRLFTDAGITDVTDDRLTVRVQYRDFDEWWEPYTLGVGPVGDYLGGISEADQEQIRRECARRLPDTSFVVTAEAWAARGSGLGVLGPDEAVETEAGQPSGEHGQQHRPGGLVADQP